MKVLLALTLGLILCGCTLPPQSTAPATPAQTQTKLLKAQDARNTACASWNTYFQLALRLKEAHQASPTLIQQTSLLDQTVTPVCTSPLPTDLNTLTAQTSQVLTNVGLLEYLVKESKK